MSNYSFEINHLQNIRYSITDAPNGNWLNQKVEWGRQNSSMSTTYAQLIQYHCTSLIADSTSKSIEQIVRNHRSALKSFLSFLGKHETSSVGSELTTDFTSATSRYLKSLIDISERTISDRRGLLNAWRTSFEKFIGSPDVPVRGREFRSSKAPAAVATPFHQRLREALHTIGLKPKAAAKASNTSTSAMLRWMRGAHPSVRSLENLKKLETFLSIPNGELVHLALTDIKARTYVPSDLYRLRLKELATEKYCLHPSEVTPVFLAQWSKFFRYKTAAGAPRGLNRHAKGRWTLAPSDKATSSPTILNAQGNMVSAAADFWWNIFSRFVGFLRLDQARNGYGLNNDEAQNLAWLAVPDAVERFLEFITVRSDGLKHGSQRAFSSCVSTMVHRVHGYLAQQPEFALTLPDHVMEGWTWDEMCAETAKLAVAWKADSSGQSRDTAAPLQYFFGHKCALEPVMDAMNRLRLEANRSNHGVKEALHRRDELLLGFLTSNPLRAKNIISLTYKNDNSGNVYMDPSGGWRIRIPGDMFKNKSRVGRDTYDVAVPTWLQPMFDDYVRDFRPRLLKEQMDPGFFFLCRGGKRFNSMNRHVLMLTRRLIPECGGISPHAFRHLVATDWLNTHPNDFATVSLLLNDTIDVVMKNYAHLKKDMAFTKYADYLNEVRSSKGL